MSENFLDDDVHNKGESREIEYTCPMCGFPMVASNKAAMTMAISLHDQLAHQFDGDFTIGKEGR